MTLFFTDDGHALFRGIEIGMGGQGSAYKCRHAGTGQSVVLKTPHDQDNPVIEQRLRALVDLKLYELHPSICAPFAIVSGPELGHISWFMEGVPLEEMLREPMSYNARLALALAITAPLVSLHDAGIAMADASPANILCKKHQRHVSAVYIDLDNFAAKGLPDPPMMPKSQYCPPEVLDGQPMSIKGDIYCLGCMQSELLLSHKALDGHNNTPELADEAAHLGWLADPKNPKRITTGNGFPSEILNTDLQGLMRASLDANPSRRPSAGDWQDALIDALDSAVACDTCKKPYFEDPSARVACPHCGKKPGALELVANGQAYVIDRVVQLGRLDLRGTDLMSAHHITLTPAGPGKARLVVAGKNGATITRHGVTKALNKNDQLLLEVGDVLDLVGIKGHITQ